MQGVRLHSIIELCVYMQQFWDLWDTMTAYIIYIIMPNNILIAVVGHSVPCCLLGRWGHLHSLVRTHHNNRVYTIHAAVIQYYIDQGCCYCIIIKLIVNNTDDHHITVHTLHHYTNFILLATSIIIVIIIIMQSHQFICRCFARQTKLMIIMMPLYSYILIRLLMLVCCL